ncbi:MAG: efflux RND transporter periplasmic adaptor subunit [Proteobacteria bacterium]|nr:efflux RND transporter periplasmic adaptor subunit [Pseudomonadota bacterium]MBS0552031.1 efflux RND transporter periplasmic adaptor subunit [Pseudomonadota bacterium]
MFPARRPVVALIALLILIGASIGYVVRTGAWPGLSSGAHHELTLSGNIEAHESVLSFKSVQSRIIELPFNEGEWVKQGTVVARLDDADYRQQVVIAEANRTLQARQLDAAREVLAAAGKTVLADEAVKAQHRLDLRRNADLRQQGFVSAAVLDQAETALKQSSAVLERDRALVAAAERNVKSAEAAVHSADEAVRLAHIVLAYTTLTAPFDGVVTVRQAEVGEVVVPGTPVVTIADLDHVWVRAYLNEKDLGRTRLGQEVTATTDSHPGKRYQGRISFIASKAEFTPKTVETHAERVTLVYRVKVDIANPSHELVPGMPADVRIELQ